MTKPDTSRARMEKLQELGCADYLHMALVEERDALAVEVNTLTQSGIVEVAACNPNVMEYIRHWESRAEKAEAEVERLREVARDGSATFKLTWIAGARPPAHPEPMTGQQTFPTLEDATAFFSSLAEDAKFVSLTKTTTHSEDISDAARSALQEKPE